MTILGHDAQRDEFLNAIRGARPHHGWLFTGPEGIGKGSLARQLAAQLLAEASDHTLIGGQVIGADHPTVQLIAAHSHPDYKLVEREIWQKSPNTDRLVPLADRKEDDAPARSIRVIQIRWLAQALSMSPSLSSRRIIIIDAADDMERGAANALLKMLEEPPAGTFFILISHSPGRLLPTIRSRCRVLRFDSLTDAAMTSALTAALPHASFEERAALAKAGEGAPGKALRFAGLDLAAMIGALDAMVTQGDADLARRQTLAQSLATKAMQKRYEVFLRLAPARLAQAAREASGPDLPRALACYDEAQRLAAMALPGSYDPAVIVLALCEQLAALAPSGASAKG